MEHSFLEKKILIHKRIKNLYGVVIDGRIGSSDEPQLFPITSSIEGLSKYHGKKALENWEMKKVVIIL